MKVHVKWFLTGKISDIEDRDDILNPNSTIAELKGLLQIRFGFSAKEILLIKDHLLENNVTLRSVGIVGQPNDPVLVAHVVRESELEASNISVDDTSKDDDLQEFSHADFILAMKMLGKEVAVSDDRMVAMRLNAPRQRPAFLNTPQAGASGPAGALQPPPTMPGFRGGAVPVYDPRNTEAYKIFARVEYGLRKVGIDQALAVHYPGLEPFAFWDIRPPDTLYYSTANLCQTGELCLELFFFGEFAAIKDPEKFKALAKQTIESKAGVRLQTPLPLREAGCMYPLVSCPVVLHEMDAIELGKIVFEDFGKKRSEPLQMRGPNDVNVAGSGGCAPQ